MFQQNTIFDTVSEVKDTFDGYFEMTGSKNFKQFYFDWHIDAMSQPFAELTTYFCENYKEEAPEKFSEFVKEFKERVSTYNADDPTNSSLKCKDFAVTKDGKLSKIIDEIESFSFQYRQFIYSFASKKDHDNEFCNWPIKTNMPYSHQHGLNTACGILDYLDKNFYSVQNAEDKEDKTRFLTDAYLRKNVVKDYKYNQNYTYAKRCDFVQKVCDLREKLSREYQRNQNNDSFDFVNMFQKETKSGATFGQYTPNGFELEFYVPENLGNYSVLIDYLKSKNGWKNIYTSNKNADVYNDGDSAGVIMRDESLTPYNQLAPVEYASKIMRSKADEQSCLKLFDSFDKGFVNVHCSLHQHVSAAGLDFNGYKRLVKRMMQHEKYIVDNFAAPERRDGRLLYATYISHNLSTNSQRDYPLLCVMVDMCDNKDELIDMSCFGHKYKTLNIVPKHTVEFRFMNAHFNKEFVSAFLQFNRDMVNSAVNNEGTHINRPLANKYSWTRNRATDNKTVYKPLFYYYEHNYDEYRPQKTVSKKTIDGEQRYAQSVVQALTQTGKLPYVNPVMMKRMKGYAK